MADDEMTTYRRVDGELIAGEFAWVTDVDFFDDDHGLDYLEVIAETWTRTGQRTLKFGELDRWCGMAGCEENVELAEPVDGPVYCPTHQPSGC